jgi:hypothetical protein
VSLLFFVSELEAGCICAENVNRYMHVTNVDVNFKRDIYKLLSVSLSPNVIGNILVGLMVKPPQPGDASYAV